MLNMKKILFSILAVGLAASVGYPQTVAPQRPRQANSRVMMRRGYLGVGVIDLTPDRAKALHRPDDSGVEVRRVDEDSPAAKAGLHENDLILEVNHQKMEDVDQFVRSISETAPGTKIELVIWRNNAKQTLTTTLDARNAMIDAFDPSFPMPPAPPMPTAPPAIDTPYMVLHAPLIGLEGEALSGQLAEFFGVKAGVLVRSVTAGTPAVKAGLKAGDVIVKVNSVTVATTREVQAMVRASRKSKVPFGVVREKKEIALDVEVQQ